MGSYVELLKACKEGNPKKVKKLLGTCKNIGDVRDLTDKTLLHYCFQNEACTDLVLEIAPELLNVGEKSGYTVLHLASMMKPPIPLQYLLSKNPDINKKTNELRTPLLLAVIYDNYEAVKILCEANAEVNVTDCLGVSPLHYAAKSKSDKNIEEQIKIIDLLLEFKAKIEFPDSFERTPLIWAVSSNNLIKMRHLISKGANINAKDVSGLSILHYATSNENLDIIETLLSEYNFDIETVDNNRCTSLMYACTKNQKSVVQALLDHGSNVNIEDLKRRSAVHFACGKGDLDIVRMLADHDADLWKANEEFTFPLHEASFKGHVEIVHFFMSHYNSNIDRLCDLINKKNANGQTALHLAAVKDHLEICRILLENGADPNIQLRASNGKSMTALELANRTLTKELIIEYNGKTSDELTNMCPITEENTFSISNESESDNDSSFTLGSSKSEEKEDSILEDAVVKIEKDHDKDEDTIQERECELEKESRPDTDLLKTGQVQRVELSLDIEENTVIEVTESLRKLLLESSYKGDSETIRSYATRGVCLSDIVDNTMKNLLHYSVKNPETFTLVLSLAPDCVNRCDNGRISVLNLAIMSKEDHSVELLLTNGADYNFVDESGRTCLHLAVMYNNMKALTIMQRLLGEDYARLEHRADNDGNYPLHYAVEMYRTRSIDHHTREYIETLLSLGGDIECRDRVARTPLLLAVNISNIEAVKVLLEHGADLLTRDKHCLSCVHYACSEGYLDILNLLANQQHFEPDIQDQNGLTPIFYAVASCNDKILQRLIDLGACVDIKDKYGRNLCHKASEKGAFKCLESLLKLGVDPWLRAHDGTMPLHEAAYRGYKEVAEILLNTVGAQDHVNVKNDSGQTALHLAAVRNDCPMCFLLINKGSSVNELLYDGSSDSNVTAYDLATTPYCKDTLYTFGGRSARRIIDNVSVEDNDDQIHRLEDLLKENSLLEAPYSVRSTELALSTLPSAVNTTARTSGDRHSQTRHKSSRTDRRQRESPCSTSTRKMAVTGTGTSNQSQSPSNESSKLPPPDSPEKFVEIACLSSPFSATVKSHSKMTMSSSLSMKRSKPSLTGSSAIRRPRETTEISHKIQDKIQSSIFNYEFMRLDSKIASDLARQKFRKENVEKLINPRTPNRVRRMKAAT